MPIPCAPYPMGPPAAPGTWPPMTPLLGAMPPIPIGCPCPWAAEAPDPPTGYIMGLTPLEPPDPGGGGGGSMLFSPAPLPVRRGWLELLLTLPPALPLPPWWLWALPAGGPLRGGRPLPLRAAAPVPAAADAAGPGSPAALCAVATSTLESMSASSSSNSEAGNTGSGSSAAGWGGGMGTAGRAAGAARAPSPSMPAAPSRLPCALAFCGVGSCAVLLPTLPTDANAPMACDSCSCCASASAAHWSLLCCSWCCCCGCWPRLLIELPLRHSGTAAPPSPTPVPAAFMPLVLPSAPHTSENSPARDAPWLGAFTGAWRCTLPPPSRPLPYDIAAALSDGAASKPGPPVPLSYRLSAW